MSPFKKSLSSAGYDLEEAFFHQLEIEKIKKMRRASPKLTLIKGGKSDACQSDNQKGDLFHEHDLRQNMKKVA